MAEQTSGQKKEMGALESLYMSNKQTYQVQVHGLVRSTEMVEGEIKGSSYRYQLVMILPDDVTAETFILKAPADFKLERGTEYTFTLQITEDHTGGYSESGKRVGWKTKIAMVDFKEGDK